MLNKKFSAIWPNINKKKDPMIEHKKYEKIKNKLKNIFQKNHLNKYAKKEEKKKKTKKLKKKKKTQKKKIKN